MSPEALAQVLCQLPILPDGNLIVGLDTSDDAAVYKLNAEQAAVLTMDFFTPVVDDAYTFGMIAAANALSDVYAMGGQAGCGHEHCLFSRQSAPSHDGGYS